jgi:hypothetical protein
MTIRRILGLFALLLVGLAFFRSPPPQKDEPKPAPPVEAPKPVELTPEQKAEQAAKKAFEDAEAKQFARDVLAVRRLQAAMKNPASFRFERASRMEDGTLCVFYRATNSFNAIVPGQAVITSNQIVVSDDRDRFIPAWNRRCANKPNTNVDEIKHFLR